VSEPPRVVPGAEDLLSVLEPVMGAETLVVALGELSRQLSMFTQAFATAAFLVDRGAIILESWHPEDEIRRARLRAHFQGLAVQSARAGEAVVVPFPAHTATGLEPHVFVLEGRGRLVGVVCFACLPQPEGPACAETTRLVGRIVRLAALRIAALQDEAAARTSSAQYQRWFKQFDQHIRLLDRERQKFAALVNRTESCVFVTDLSGTIRWTNQPLARRFRAPAATGGWVGHSCRELCARMMGDGGAPCSSCPVARSLESTQAAHSEVRVPAGADGALRATALPIRGLEGRAQEVIVVIQDVTAQGELPQAA
jgi:PAS domain-containing protein